MPRHLASPHNDDRALRLRVDETPWSRGPRPDGLFIFSHSAVRGSLTALLEIGVNIPEELKLVAHGNINREEGRSGGIFE